MPALTVEPWLLWPLGVLVVVGVVCGVARLLMAQDRAGRERRRALEALATEMGGAFTTEKRRGAPNLPTRTHFFSGQLSAYNTNILRVPAPDDPRIDHIEAGDHVFISDAERNVSSYILVRTRLFGMPRTVVRPENVADRAALALGLDDVNTESTEFSLRFHVHSAEKRFAYDLLDPRMMELLLEQPREATIVLEGDAVLIHLGQTARHNLRGVEEGWSIDRFRRTIGFAREFVGAIPGHLAQRVGA